MSNDEDQRVIIAGELQSYAKHGQIRGLYNILSIEFNTESEDEVIDTIKWIMKDRVEHVQLLMAANELILENGV